MYKVNALPAGLPFQPLCLLFLFKIILKERQERMQQRLQENTGSPAISSDKVFEAESGSTDSQPDATGTSFCWLLQEPFAQGRCTSLHLLVPVVG